MVSCNVFDESKGWNWTSSELVQDDISGAITFGFEGSNDKEQSNESEGTTQVEIETETAAEDNIEVDEDDEDYNSENQDDQPRLRRSSRTHQICIS